MNPPFPLLFATLLFWGWMTRQWEAAWIMALGLEASRWLSWRWRAEDKDLYRVADFGSLLLVGLLAYPHLVGQREVPAVFYEMQILPLAVFPLLLAQVYTVRGDFPLSGLFYALRKAGSVEKKHIHLDYPFMGLCLVSASANLERSVWYFPGLLVLMSLALWWHRPRRYQAGNWLLVWALAIGLAYPVQTGLVALQQAVGDQMAEWILQWVTSQADPYRRGTALGDVGPLKTSERILFRVDQPQPWTMPLLLREASYNRLVGQTWYGPSEALRELPIATEVGFWQLVPDRRDAAQITVYRSFARDAVMIQTPLGASRLESLPAVDIGVNDFGAVKARKTPAFVGYRVYFDARQSFDAPPGEADLLVPSREQPAVRQVALQLELAGQPPAEVLQRIARFFLTEFRYTLHLTNQGSGATPVARFLLEHRAGHCEYFATATVLLLRQAGIPSRYVFGYSVHEAEGRLRVVRQRHAHAWAQAWIQGTWQNLDNTPPDWQNLEEEQAPFWHGLPDLWSRLLFEINRWQQEQGDERQNWPWLVVLAVLAGVLAWRTVRGKATRQTRNAPVRTPVRQQPFDRIEARLAEQGWPRLAGEPRGFWLRRIHRTELLPLLALHYRCCFDPLPPPPEVAQRLAEAVDAWLNQQNQPS